MKHVVVAGASGVIGSSAVSRFADLDGSQVTAVSRRRPVLPDTCRFDHASVDLRDEQDCARLVKTLRPATHLVYAAVSEAPGLVSGWQDPSLIEENGTMLRNLLTPLAQAGSLRHVSILQGAKAYGAHVHQIRVPLRESEPRDDHPSFYWLHEDCTRELAERHGFVFTIWRPQILFGSAPGVAMNPVAAIGAYAAICRERSLPFALPGDGEALWETVDADLFADALAWASTAPEAANETFNFTNGDVFVLRHAWADIAALFGLIPYGPAPESLAAFFAGRESIDAWSRLTNRHGLRFQELQDLLGESHHYLDLLSSARLANKQTPPLMSTIKLRKAGFAGCIGSLESLQNQLRRMESLMLLPRTGGKKMRKPGVVT